MIISDTFTDTTTITHTHKHTHIFIGSTHTFILFQNCPHLLAQQITNACI